MAVPSANLLRQWTALIESFYSVPYTVFVTRAQRDALTTEEEPNPFLQDTIVIATYKFAAVNDELAKAVPWNLAVFVETSSLSAVYQDGNRQARAFKRIAGGAFKPLLTGTPFEKNLWISMA